jgi:hypothetical protein
VQLPATQAPLARLAVLEDFTFADIVGDATTIMFELDSDAVLITCDVDIQCYGNGKLYDSFSLRMEAGCTIPNTHVLDLTQLEEGQHDIYFSLSVASSEVQHEKFSFWVSEKQVSRPTSQKPAIAVASPVDMSLLTNKMMREGVFNSRSSSSDGTCIGGVSSTSEASYGLGNTSEEELFA